MNLIQTFNRFGGQYSENLRKSLYSAVNVGEALIPQKLEQIITNSVVYLSPVQAMLEAEFDSQKLHEFNRVTDLGLSTGAGIAMGENGTTPYVNSSYQRANVTLKIVRHRGAVTDFLQESSARYIDAFAAEVENQIRAFVYKLDYYALYGNADANAYEYSGYDRLVTTNRYNDGFSAGVPTVPANLTFLDKMIDASNRKGGHLHKRAFIMTPEMLSKVSSMLTNVRLNQGMDGQGKVDIRGGWRLDSYRDIPILQSTAMSGAGAGTMTTVTAASAGTTGGAFSNGTYYFRVAPITITGEQMASAESSVMLSGGTATQQINLTFTAFPGAFAYKIYYGASTGIANSALIDMKTSNVYDGSGTPTGIGTVATLNVLSPTATSAVSGMTSDKPLSASGGYNGETIMLIDFDKYQGLGKFPYTNAGGRVGGLVTFEPLAKTDAFRPFLLYTHGAICPAFEATSVISRGWKVA